MDYKKLTKLQLDIIREAGNMGAAHAATALSQIVKQTIMIKVPEIKIIEIKEFSKIIGKAKKVVCICLQVLGDVTGGILLVLNWDKAMALADMLKGEKLGSTKMLTDMDQSALKECGSIITASYLRAIGKFMEISLVYSVPKLAVGSLGKVMGDIFKELSRRTKIAFCIDTQFTESKNNITGHFIIIPEVKGLEIMLSKLGRGTK